MPDRIYTHGIWLPFFAIALLPIPFQIYQTVKTGRWALTTSGSFARLLLVQNLFALLLSVGQAVLLTEKYYPTPGNILVNYGLGSSMLLHSILLLQRFGLFRVVIPWYNENRQRTAVIATVFIHVLLFLPNYLQYLVTEVNYHYDEKYYWMQPWMIYGTMVWSLYVVVVDTVTSISIIRYLITSRRFLAPFDPASAAQQLKTSSTGTTEKPTKVKLKAENEMKKLTEFDRNIISIVTCLGCMVAFDVIGLALFAAALDAIAITLICFHYIAANVFFNLVTETIRP